MACNDQPAIEENKNSNSKLLCENFKWLEVIELAIKKYSSKLRGVILMQK